jgi:hypothetical protein
MTDYKSFMYERWYWYWESWQTKRYVVETARRAGVTCQSEMLAIMSKVAEKQGVKAMYDDAPQNLKEQQADWILGEIRYETQIRTETRPEKHRRWLAEFYRKQKS